MSIYQRVPDAPLNQYVAWLWHYRDYYPDHDRQFVLPDGTFELIINLEDRGRKLFDRDDFRHHRIFKRAWISGAQRTYQVIDALPGSAMIGVHFKPSGAAPFLGLPAGELSDQVVELENLWGPTAVEWREQLLAAAGPQDKLEVLHQLLIKKLLAGRQDPGRARRIHWALGQFLAQPHQRRIRDVPAELGMSHKHFIAQFKEQVGLTPKLFCRVRRFGQVLAQIQSRRHVSWADVASDCGYFDQAHFINDFVAFSGVNPSAYLRQRLDGDVKFIRASS